MAILKEQQAESKPDTTMAVMRAAEGFLESNHSSNCIPRSISTSGKDAGEESNNSFFENWLGEYDLNDIPSLLTADPQQELGSSSELDSFYFSSASGNLDIPFITSNVPPSTKNPSDAAPEVIQSDRLVHNKKRSSAEVSEDEANEVTSSFKTRRPVSSYSSASSSNSGDEGTSPGITWTTGSRKSRKPTGYATSTLPSIDDDDNAEHFEYMSGMPPPDTSTAHIKALTGSNGAAMCFDIVNAMNKDYGETKSFPNSASTTEMSPEEKKKLNRARNRVHARNTRIRKQAHIEELKRTLLKMLAERDAEHESKEQHSQMEADERSVRYNVLEEFLRLRTTKETSISRWNAILEDDMKLELPNANSSKNMFFGVTEIMKESQENNIFGGASFSIQCHQDTFLMDGTNAVMDWTATFAGRDIKIRGICRASFNPQSNKLHSVSMIYDSAPVQHYL